MNYINKRIKDIKKPRFRQSMYTIDKKDLKNPNKVSIFAKDIFNYYIQNESNYLIDSKDKLCDLSTNRINCINTILNFVNILRLNDDTFNLSVYLFDFYLFNIKQIIKRSEFIYLIITCLFIASKFYEITYITLNYILSYIENFENLEKEKIIELESVILEKNNYKLNKIDDKDILKRIILMEGHSEEIYISSSFFLEMSIYNTKYFKFKPSERAIACLFWILKIKGLKDNAILLKKKLNFDYNNIQEFQKIIFDVIELNKKNKLGIFKKIDKINNKYLKSKIKELFTMKLI